VQLLVLTIVGPPVATALRPTTVFLGEENIVLDIVATGLYNSKWLSCSVAGVLLPGTLLEDAGEQFVRCVVPSTWVVSAAAGAPPGEATFVPVEASNDGQMFSESGLELRLVASGQLQ